MRVALLLWWYVAEVVRDIDPGMRTCGANKGKFSFGGTGHTARLQESTTAGQGLHVAILADN